MDLFYDVYVQLRLNMSSSDLTEAHEPLNEENKCVFTRTAEKWCTRFLGEIHNATEDFDWDWSDLKCVAQQGDNGVRVVLQLFRGNELQTQTIVRLSSLVDLHLLDNILDGHRDALHKYVAKMFEGFSEVCCLKKRKVD